MTDDNILSTIKNQIQTDNPHILREHKEGPFVAFYGALTSSIPQDVRPQLRRLERQGKLLCFRVQGGTSKWWPVGLLDEIKAAR